MLNQLMTLLNTAYTAGRKTEVEEAAAKPSEVEERPRARVSTLQQQQVGHPLSLVIMPCTLLKREMQDRFWIPETWILKNSSESLV